MEITLERGGRWLPRGRCPNYKVTLRSDNTATYVGRDTNDKRRGTYTGNIEFAPIAAKIASMGFFDLQDLYGKDVSRTRLNSSKQPSLTHP